jgi:riboflavin kinase/FMN adenylyltransferase
MKLLHGIQQGLISFRETAATIGNFDGVHRGHQALLKSLRVKAQRLNLPVLVMLFEPQPSEYFRPEHAPARLSSLREKIEWFKQCDVDYVWCLNFNNYLATMPAETFAKQIIFSLMKAKYLLIGQDFHFGQGRLGDIHLLKKLAEESLCTVDCFSDFFIDNQRVSSTKIREALQASDLNHAAKLLGHPYSLCGRVIEGDKRGRQWGIPTANLSLRRKILPLKGVFCVKVQGPKNKQWSGVANIGCRPTVDGVKNILEVHLFDMSETLYGDMLQVHFLHKLRDETKFASIDALIAQIHEDIRAARYWFKNLER